MQRLQQLPFTSTRARFNNAAPWTTGSFAVFDEAWLLHRTCHRNFICLNIQTRTTGCGELRYDVSEIVVEFSIRLHGVLSRFPVKLEIVDCPNIEPFYVPGMATARYRAHESMIR